MSETEWGVAKHHTEPSLVLCDDLDVPPSPSPTVSTIIVLVLLTIGLLGAVGHSLSSERDFLAAVLTRTFCFKSDKGGSEKASFCIHCISNVFF